MAENSQTFVSPKRVSPLGIAREDWVKQTIQLESGGHLHIVTAIVMLQNMGIILESWPTRLQTHILYI